MRWPFRRTSTPSPATAVGAGVGGGESGAGAGSSSESGAADARAGWIDLPPLQRSTADLAPIAPAASFRESLAAHQDPRFLAPLGHSLVVDAPAGEVGGYATPVSEQAHKVSFPLPPSATISGTAASSAPVDLQRTVDGGSSPSVPRAYSLPPATTFAASELPVVEPRPVPVTPIPASPAPVAPIPATPVPVNALPVVQTSPDPVGSTSAATATAPSVPTVPFVPTPPTRRLRRPCRPRRPGWWFRVRSGHTITATTTTLSTSTLSTITTRPSTSIATTPRPSTPRASTRVTGRWLLGKGARWLRQCRRCRWSDCRSRLVNRRSCLRSVVQSRDLAFSGQLRPRRW